MGADRGLTAVSSIVLSSGSTFPPGKEVSPAYVLSEADRLSEIIQFNQHINSSAFLASY